MLSIHLQMHICLQGLLQIQQTARKKKRDPRATVLLGPWSSDPRTLSPDLRALHSTAAHATQSSPWELGAALPGGEAMTSFAFPVPVVAWSASSDGCGPGRGSP